MRAMAISGITALAALLLVGCTAAAEPARSPAPTPRGPASSGSPSPVGEPQTVAAGLDAPWSIAFLSDGTPLISERDTGEILELADDGSARIVGTVEDVRAGGEGGLLGLAVDERDRLYAYSTGPDGNRIHRFALAGEAGALSLGEPETIIRDLPAARNHDGGRIAFGPDGMLYATVGDAGQRADAQNLDSLAGKILRMDPDGGVPADNPFPGSYVYSYGHRNPQGIAWAADGTMLATEFGQDTWDELNIITPAGDYGWPDVEGIAGGGQYIDPVQQWAPAEASPSGMAIVDDVVYIANLRGETLRIVSLDDLTASDELHSGEYGRLRDVTLAPDGGIWFLTNNTDGRGEPAPDDDRIVRIAPVR